MDIDGAKSIFDGAGWTVSSKGSEGYAEHSESGVVAEIEVAKGIAYVLLEGPGGPPAFLPPVSTSVELKERVRGVLENWHSQGRALSANLGRDEEKPLVVIDETLLKGVEHNIDAHKNAILKVTPKDPDSPEYPRFVWLLGVDSDEQSLSVVPVKLDVAVGDSGQSESIKLAEYTAEMIEPGTVKPVPVVASVSQAFEPTPDGMEYKYTITSRLGDIGRADLLLANPESAISESILNRPALKDVREACLTSIEIRPEWRHQGLGKELLKRVENDARTNGGDILSLNDQGDFAAKNIYRQAGLKSYFPENPNGLCKPIASDPDRNWILRVKLDGDLTVLVPGLSQEDVMASKEYKKGLYEEVIEPAQRRTTFHRLLDEIDDKRVSELGKGNLHGLNDSETLGITEKGIRYANAMIEARRLRMNPFTIDMNAMPAFVDAYSSRLEDASNTVEQEYRTAYEELHSAFLERLKPRVSKEKVNEKAAVQSAQTAEGAIRAAVQDALQNNGAIDGQIAFEVEFGGRKAKGLASYGRAPRQGDPSPIHFYKLVAEKGPEHAGQKYRLMRDVYKLSSKNELTNSGFEMARQQHIADVLAAGIDLPCPLSSALTRNVEGDSHKLLLNGIYPIAEASFDVDFISTRGLVDGLGADDRSLTEKKAKITINPAFKEAGVTGPVLDVLTGDIIGNEDLITVETSNMDAKDMEVMKSKGFVTPDQNPEVLVMPISERAKGLFLPAEMTANKSADATFYGILAGEIDLPLSVLKQRDDEINSTPASRLEPTPPTNLPLGSMSIDWLGPDNAEAYVRVLQEVPVEKLVNSEHEEDIKSHDTYKQYLAWAKEGREPPAIIVNESDKGSLISINRRRTLAAKEAGVRTIKAWLSPINKDTGLPLKYKDVVEGMQKRIDVDGVLRPTKNGVDSDLQRLEGTVIADNQGNPKLMYHGSGEAFDEFDPAKGGGVGMYFTDRPDEASEFASHHANGSVYPVFLSIKNPAPADIVRREYDKAGGGNPRKVAHDALRAMGYDGIVRSAETIVFDKDQIMSAVGFTGRFSGKMHESDLDKIAVYADQLANEQGFVAGLTLESGDGVRALTELWDGRGVMAVVKGNELILNQDEMKTPADIDVALLKSMPAMGMRSKFQGHMDFAYSKLLQDLGGEKRVYEAAKAVDPNYSIMADATHDRLSSGGVTQKQYQQMLMIQYVALLAENDKYSRVSEDTRKALKEFFSSAREIADANGVHSLQVGGASEIIDVLQGISVAELSHGYGQPMVLRQSIPLEQCGWENTVRDILIDVGMTPKTTAWLLLNARDNLLDDFAKEIAPELSGRKIANDRGLENQVDTENEYEGPEF